MERNLNLSKSNLTPALKLLSKFIHQNSTDLENRWCNSVDRIVTIRLRIHSSILQERGELIKTGIPHHVRSKMERDLEESSWIEARWLCHRVSSRLCYYNSRMPNGSCDNPRGSQPRLIPPPSSRRPSFLPNCSRIASLTLWSIGLEFESLSPNRAISLYRAIALPCSKFVNELRDSPRSSTHQPCPLGISMLDTCHNEASRRLDERILSKRILGILERWIVRMWKRVISLLAVGWIKFPSFNGSKRASNIINTT